MRQPSALYTVVSNPKMPLIDALRMAVHEHGYQDLLEDGTVAKWATNLSQLGVNVLGDLEEPNARAMLKKGGVMNMKLCSSILQIAFPVEEPEVDKAASDEQYEYWNGVVEKLKEFRLAGQWAEMEPYILEHIDKAEGDTALHPHYLPQLFQELAQCYFNLGRWDKAEEANSAALSIYSDASATHLWMQAMHFQGFVYVERKEYFKAEMSFQIIVDWAEGAAKTASPVESSAAADLVLQSRAEMGIVKVKLGNLKEAESVLSANLVEASKANNFSGTFRTLEGLVECFDALKDYKRCLSVAERGIAWCQKHNRPDEAQVIFPLIDKYKEILKDE
jgi:tetratricopeptide (TPR) repeat protein